MQRSTPTGFEAARTGVGTARAGVEATVVFALALAVRLLPWREVVRPDGVHFFGNDAWYHARRVLWGLQQFPHVLHHDPYIHPPGGADVIWPPLFDAAATALAGLASGGGDHLHTVELVLVCLPPVLGALTAVGVWWLGRRLFGAGLAAGLLLALVPAHVDYARIGFLDHHVAVAGLGLSLLVAAIALAGPGRRGAVAAATGLLEAGALLTWPGMVLEVAILHGIVLAAAATRAAGSEARRLLLGLALADAVAAAVLAPFAWGRVWEIWGAWSPVVLSRLQPTLLAVAAASLLLARTALVEGRLSFGRRVLAALVGVVPVLVLVAAARPLLEPGVAQALAWLAKGEAFQATVAESRPLLFGERAFGPARTAEHLGALFFLAPVWLYAGWRAARVRSPVGAWAWLGWTLVLLAVTLVQMRFAAAFAPLYVLGAGATLGWLARAAGGGWRGRAVAVGAALLLFAPSLAASLAPVGDVASAVRGRAHEPGAHAARRHRLAAVGRFLREHTPATPGYLGGEARPTWGVLAHWADGHLLRYVSRRPMVVDNFGDDASPEAFDAAAAFWLETRPEVAQALLERLAARYVLAEARPVVGHANLPAAAMLPRLALGDGSATDAAPALERGVPRPTGEALASVPHLRLVHEVRVLEHAPPWRAFKLFERVAGARLEGRGPAGGAATAEIDVVAPTGRRFTWRTGARIGADGRFRLDVPYATAWRSPTVSTAPFLRVRSGDREWRVRVPEVAVREGRAVPVDAVP